MNCTSYVAKTKALISFTVTAKLVCAFVFACAKSRFSHDAAHLVSAMSGIKDYRLHTVLICLSFILKYFSSM